jgi:ribonuclease HI
VDEIADALARNETVELYDGPLVGYAHAIHDLPDDTAVPKRPAGTAAGGRRAKTPAHSYVSVVDGKPMRHATWADCERRVKGQSGARFKKATSAADEIDILRSWRVDPRDL